MEWMLKCYRTAGNEPGTPFRRVTFSQKTSFLEYNVLRVLILLYTRRIYGNSKKSIFTKIDCCQHDGQIKVITGLRRCGKSFLLFHLFKNYLLKNGIDNQQIITFELDQMKDIQYRNPIELSKKIHSIVDNTTQQYYLFIDEIQMSDEVNNPYNPKGKKFFSMIC